MPNTTHRFLHPTKGWRMFARPRKTNRRRKLIPQGVLLVPHCKAYAKNFRRTGITNCCTTAATAFAIA